MIYTCTLNPALDYVIQHDEVTLGSLNRTKNADILIGGKAVNVSLVLGHFGIMTKATGFIGGFTGDYLEQVLNYIPFIRPHFFKVDTPTRINLKLREKDRETEINPIGPTVNDQEFQAFLTWLKALSSEDTLICGGSSVDGQPQAYKKIADVAKTRGIRLVMDTPGHYIKDYAHAHPFLMKPNIHELEAYYGTTIHTMEEVIRYGRKLIDLGVTYLMISMGKDGSILMTKDKILHGLPTEVEAIGTTGAGDSMIAGFLYGIEEGCDVETCYRYAIAASIATVKSGRLAEKEGMMLMFNHVRIETIHDQHQ